MKTYGVYQGKEYPITITGQKVLLKSRKNVIGFSAYIDLTGNLHEDLFVKEVEKSELEDAFQRTTRAIYKGNDFEVLNEMEQDTEEIELFTMDIMKAETLSFLRHDQLSYKKTVTRRELDGVRELKIPFDLK